VKFTDSGEVCLHISRHSQQAADDGIVTLSFAVSDTGIGIDEAHLTRLFQPFTQADESITRRYGGTGLGLAICQQLVAAMGGKIEAASSPGKGSCFSFAITLPFEAGTEVTPLAAQSTVLLIHRHDGIRNNTSDILQGLGLNVISASGIGTARALLYQHGDITPGLLVAELPENASAAEHLANLRRLVPGREPDILLIAARYSGSLADDDSPVPLLVKPLSPEQLRQAILHEQEALPGQTSETASNSGCLKGKQILLAEDNVINRQIACELLEEAGARVSCAENGQQAVEMALHGLFDAVLMDVHMPVMDGMEASRQIRAQGLTTLPIIAVTAHAFDAARQEALEAGMDEHLSKPYTPEQLYRLLCRFVSPQSQETASSTPESHTLPGIQAGPLPMSLNPEQFQSLLRKFRQHHAEDAGKLRQAWQQGDIETIQLIAHNLKSVGHYINAPHMQQLAKELDAQAKAGSPPAKLVEELASAIDAIQAGLKAHFNTTEHASKEHK